MCRPSPAWRCWRWWQRLQWVSDKLPETLCCLMC
jgi:hypothetical protein